MIDVNANPSREDNKTLQIEIVRAVIQLKAVRSKIENNIGYIRVSSFNQKVDTQIIKAIKDLPKMETIKIVTREELIKNKKSLLNINHKNAEALFVSCTSLPVLNIIEKLESKLNMTVLSSNQALIWETLEKINKNKSVMGYGSLFN